MDATLSRGAQPARRFIPALAALCAVLVAAAAVQVGVARSSAGDGAPAPSTLSRSLFQEKTGVRVIRVAVTGGGGLVDFRYQVIDPEKAERLHLAPPSLVEEKTGEILDLLFMGHSHGGTPKAGYTYPLLFINERGAVKRGGSVTVVVGDARLEHVPAL